MQRIKQFIIVSLTLLLATTAFAMVGSAKVYASDAISNSQNAACQGAQLGDANNPCTDTTSNTLSDLLKTVLSILSIIVGIAAIIMVIVGGFRYVLSAGDSANTNSARNTIIYALVGLLIAALAQVLIHFVLSRVNSCPSGQTGTPGNCTAAPLTKIGKPS